MFGAFLGYFQDVVGALQSFFADAVDFVAGNDGDFLPCFGGVELQGYGGVGLFEGADCPAVGAEGVDGLEGGGPVVPFHGVFGAEGCFVDVGMRGQGCDAAEMKGCDAEGVGGAQQGADVVGAADVVGDEADGQLGEKAIVGQADACEFGDVFLEHGAKVTKKMTPRASRRRVSHNLTVK